jgi:hypothetical protein
MFVASDGDTKTSTEIPCWTMSGVILSATNQSLIRLVLYNDFVNDDHMSGVMHGTGEFFHFGASSSSYTLIYFDIVLI